MIHLPPDIIYDLGWTLIHFLWQGLVLAAVLQTILPMCRDAPQRHNWALAILAMMAVAPVLTFLFIHGHQSVGLAAGGIVFPRAPISFGWIEFLVGLWLCGIGVLGLRALGGWFLVESLWREDALALPDNLLRRCRALQKQLALTRPVIFLQSCRVNGPVVIGWLRPVILIPVSAIAGLPPQQLDALITHELAHIRRCDTFVNFALVMTEILLFYHPAVWWVSRRVRLEREHCCDDFAVAMCGDATLYVEALTSLKTAKPLPVLALAASGGKLKDRVARLLDIPSNSRKISPCAVVGLLFLAAIATTAATARNSQGGAAGVVHKPELVLRSRTIAKVSAQKAVHDEGSGYSENSAPQVGARYRATNKKKPPPAMVREASLSPAGQIGLNPAGGNPGQDQPAAVQTVSDPEPAAAISVMHPMPATTELASVVERVIVTAPRWMGDKPETVIHNFVNSYAMAATSTVGEISRWKFGICARTYGLSKPEYNQFVTDRIENIAVEVGAGIKFAPCRTNVEIVFTDKPQEFLEQVHAQGAQLLGSKLSQAAVVDQMRYAVEAWYATGTRDLSGSLVLDDEDNNGGFIDDGKGGLGVFATTPTRTVEGFRWRTGLNSELAHIYIIADTTKTQGQELGAVTDYVAMLALSQTQTFDACKPIPSITNLIAPGCSADLKSKSLTDADFAYLKAVYSMDPGADFKQQQNFIAASMATSLGVN